MIRPPLGHRIRKALYGDARWYRYLARLTTAEAARDARRPRSEPTGARRTRASRPPRPGLVSERRHGVTVTYGPSLEDRTLAAVLEDNIVTPAEVLHLFNAGLDIPTIRKAVHATGARPPARPEPPHPKQNPGRSTSW